MTLKVISGNDPEMLSVANYFLIDMYIGDVGSGFIGFIA